MRWVGLTCGVLLVPLIGLATAAESPSSSSEKPAGTGVIVHPDGYILTAHHVISNARRIVVVTPGEFRAPAIVASTDADHDLALLKIETVGLSEAPIGYAGAVRLDEEIIVIGYQFGLRDVSVSRGRIAAVRTRGVNRVFQVDAAVNPGNSGGPVFNQLGEVVGIVTTKFTHPSGIAPEGMGFVVPISYATPLLANIPDFNFPAIGKSPRKSKRNVDKMMQEMARTTVRIETVRFAEPLPQPAPAEPAAGQSKAEAKPEARHAPIQRSQPNPGKDHAGAENSAAISRVNEQLAAIQQEELKKLSERGARLPDGMVLIPAGEFLMGADDGLPDARPLHPVYLSSFWIDKYETTNAEYRRCVEAGVCQPPKDRQVFDDPQRVQHPVANLTWGQARAFCQWRGRHLPTEAEWEKAARGTDGRRYPWGNGEEVINNLVKEQTVRSNGSPIGPIGNFPTAQSPYGVYDLVGNVWEWVKDWYAEDYYASAPPRDPQGPLRGSFRVLRGGDWSQSPFELRGSYRGWDEMTYWGPTLGFRCAADMP